ncbi:MAG: GNAT family N-acetyltransferase [Nocardioidaceae bacterium]
MLRSVVQVADATLEDVAGLVEIWGGGSGRPDRSSGTDPLAVGATSVARIAADPDQRLLVARVEGVVVGAAHLVCAQLSPVHSESVVHLLHLGVLEPYRGQGVSTALVEATVTWAEEKDVSHVRGAVTASSRDANRFMTRLGLAQVAVLRGATTAALRARLPVEAPAVARTDRRSHRNVGTVLAKRRSLRRAEQTRPV